MNKCEMDLFLLLLLVLVTQSYSTDHHEVNNTKFYQLRHGPHHSERFQGPKTADDGCQLNILYDPVCASNSKTYANLEAMQCWNKRNPNNQVDVIAFRKCAPLKCATYDKMSPKIGGRPFKPEAANVHPVCASNGLTYDSIDQVHCIFKYFPNITIRHEGGCTVHEIRKIFGMNLKSQACTLAARRYEWNPVCTSQHVTYPNPFILLCQTPHVRIISMGECGSHIQKACLAARRLNKVLNGNNKRRFLVCGSDGETYRSIMHLRCSSQMNKHLQCLHRGPCRRNHNVCAATPRIICSSGHPVCGSDGLTYITPATLYCAQRTFSPKLKYLHAGTCLPGQL